MADTKTFQHGDFFSNYPDTILLLATTQIQHGRHKNIPTWRHLFAGGTYLVVAMQKTMRFLIRRSEDVTGFCGSGGKIVEPKPSNKKKFQEYIVEQNVSLMILHLFVTI